VSDFDPVPIASEVELFAVVEASVSAAACAFASVTNVGKAAINASAFDEKSDGDVLLGGVGSGVIAIINLLFRSILLLKENIQKM
jgi:hypothetical protein